MATTLLATPQRPKLFKPVGGNYRLKQDHWFRKGLVGYWPMLKGGGSKVFDLSGNSSIGTFTGTPLWVGGLFGPCLNFPTSSDYISVTPESNYDLKTPFTIMCWMYRAADGNYDWLFWKSYSAYEFAVYSQNKLYLEGQIGEARLRVRGDITLTNGWHHCVMIWKGVAATTEFYLDGKLDTTTVITDPINIGDFDNTSTVPRIGYFNTSGGRQCFTSIWNRVLTAGEIMQLYLNPFCGIEEILPMTMVIGEGEAPTGVVRRKVNASLASGRGLIGGGLAA